MRARRIPELDTLLPYRQRAPKRGVHTCDMDSASGSSAAAAPTSAEGNACASLLATAPPRPRMLYSADVKPKAEKVEEKDVKDEKFEDTPSGAGYGVSDVTVKAEPVAARAAPAAAGPCAVKAERAPPAEVYINACGVVVDKDALGPRPRVCPPHRPLGTWSDDLPADHDADPPDQQAKVDVLAMERRLRAAHVSHFASEARKRPAAAVADGALAAGVLKRRRIKGKQPPRPAAVVEAGRGSGGGSLGGGRGRGGRRGVARGSAGRGGPPPAPPAGGDTGYIADAAIRERARVAPNQNCFQSWAYYTVRQQLKKKGYDDVYCKAKARVWHATVLTQWAEVRGGHAPLAAP